MITFDGGCDFADLKSPNMWFDGGGYDAFVCCTIDNIVSCSSYCDRGSPGTISGTDVMSLKYGMIPTRVAVLAKLESCVMPNLMSSKIARTAALRLQHTTEFRSANPSTTYISNTYRRSAILNFHVTIRANTKWS